MCVCVRACDTRAQPYAAAMGACALGARGPPDAAARWDALLVVPAAPGASYDPHDMSTLALASAASSASAERGRPGGPAGGLPQNAFANAGVHLALAHEEAFTAAAVFALLGAASHVFEAVRVPMDGGLGSVQLFRVAAGPAMSRLAVPHLSPGALHDLLSALAGFANEAAMVDAATRRIIDEGCGDAPPAPAVDDGRRGGARHRRRWGATAESFATSARGLLASFRAALGDRERARAVARGARGGGTAPGASLLALRVWVAEHVTPLTLAGDVMRTVFQELSPADAAAARSMRPPRGPDPTPGERACKLLECVYECAVRYAPGALDVGHGERPHLPTVALQLFFDALHPLLVRADAWVHEGELRPCLSSGDGDDEFFVRAMPAAAPGEEGVWGSSDEEGVQSVAAGAGGGAQFALFPRAWTSAARGVVAVPSPFGAVAAAAAAPRAAPPTAGAARATATPSGHAMTPSMETQRGGAVGAGGGAGGGGFSHFVLSRGAVPGFLTKACAIAHRAGASIALVRAVAAVAGASSSNFAGSAAALAATDVALRLRGPTSLPALFAGSLEAAAAEWDAAQRAETASADDGGDEDASASQIAASRDGDDAFCVRVRADDRSVVSSAAAAAAVVAAEEASDGDGASVRLVEAVDAPSGASNEEATARHALTATSGTMGRAPTLETVATAFDSHDRAGDVGCVELPGSAHPQAVAVVSTTVGASAEQGATPLVASSAAAAGSRWGASPDLDHRPRMQSGTALFMCFPVRACPLLFLLVIHNYAFVYRRRS